MIFSEGNLGTRGMALFFYTHECNPICTRLNLTPFDLSSTECERQTQQRLASPLFAATACRTSEQPLSSTVKLNSFCRRNRSVSSEYESDDYLSKTSSSPLSSSTSQLFPRNISERSSTAVCEENMFTLPPVSNFNI